MLIAFVVDFLFFCIYLYFFGDLQTSSPRPSLFASDANATDKGVSHKVKGAVCRLESIGDILKIIFRDGGTTHANYYRVSLEYSNVGSSMPILFTPSLVDGIICILHSDNSCLTLIFYSRFMFRKCIQVLQIPLKVERGIFLLPRSSRMSFISFLDVYYNCWFLFFV